MASNHSKTGTQSVWYLNVYLDQWYSDPDYLDVSGFQKFVIQIPTVFKRLFESMLPEIFVIE